MVQIRSPLPPPATPAAVTTGVRCVKFRHPAYPDTQPELLRLIALDGDDNEGVDYDTALLSCGIVTGNLWGDGWLAAKDAEGAFRPIDSPADGILRDEVYYFCLHGHEPDEKYPVIPSFDHWRFPHGNLPYPWSALHIHPADTPSALACKLAAMARDKTCRISGYSDALETAHLVPEANGHWFSSNRMARYCGMVEAAVPTDDAKNLLVLRRDLHHLFDQRRFAFAAKRSGDDGGQSAELVMHVFRPIMSAQLATLYHNRTLHALSGISVELLFARFAWTLFSDEIFPFFSGRHEYAVSLFDPETSTVTDNSMRASQIRDKSAVFGSFSRNRTVNPRKRRRSNDEARDSEDDWWDQVGDSGDDSEMDSDMDSQGCYWEH